VTRQPVHVSIPTGSMSDPKKQHFENAAGYTVRQYGENSGDWEMVSMWWGVHTVERAIVETLLPPVGVVVEHNGKPVAACWCHLSAGIGIAFLDSPVARPGMKLSESAAAMIIALDAIEAICRTHDYVRSRREHAPWNCQVFGAALGGLVRVGIENQQPDISGRCDRRVEASDKANRRGRLQILRPRRKRGCV
jgi:hypothetical protein